MTTEAILNREHVQRLEPQEVDATGSTWLSGYAIPVSVSALVQEGKVSRFEFQYPTSNLRSEEPTLIDNLKQPAVAVAFTPGIRRVLAVHFFPKVAPTELPGVVERLLRYASQEQVVGKKLSLKLAANLIGEAADEKLWDWSSSVSTHDAEPKLG
jgi:hypothetical protein